MISPPLSKAFRREVGAMTNADALVVTGLSKSFGKPAVDNLDLTVRAGEFYALLGANGAGKTTTLRMIVGLLKPDAGAISVFGVDARADPARAKQMIAWAPDEPLLYDRLTPMEYLEFVAGLWGVEAKTARTSAETLLKWLGLWTTAPSAARAFRAA